ncbi:hypothetical protein [Actinoplanes sp. NPDC049802]|uniref:hypothetical protein n=1 Tax=Actinoplanes sp. NPDC049802 TaxID=3154742 RepID=UPI00340D4817
MRRPYPLSGMDARQEPHVASRSSRHNVDADAVDEDLGQPGDSEPTALCRSTPGAGFVAARGSRCGLTRRVAGNAGGRAAALKWRLNRVQAVLEHADGELRRPGILHAGHRPDHIQASPEVLYSLRYRDQARGYA